MATDKQVRGFKKAAFTKLISKLNRLMAEDSKDDVKDLLVELSNAYNAFEEAHNIVCEHNIDFDDFMKDEQYFLDVGKQYTQCLNDIKPWLNGDGLAAAVQPPSCNHNLGKLLTLPKIDIQPYDGDCMLYSSFISVFKRCVESVLDDDEDRLIHLKRLTTSHAASAILSCNGSSGYKRALSILEQRFGNKHLIAHKIKAVHPPAKVDLLIGQDNSEALVPLQVLKGNPGDPFAVLTKFGYSLNGVVPGSSPDCVSLAVVSNFVHISIDAKVDAVKDIADVRVCSTLKSLSVSTDCKILDICYGESDLVDGHVDLPIPQEVCHIDNNFPVILSNCYKPLLTSVDKISIMSDCDDTVKTITCKGLADDIHVDVVQDHDPMSSHAPYYPVLNCSSDAYIFFDYDSRLREYSHNDCVFCGPPMNSSLSSEFLYCSSSCYSYDRNALRPLTFHVDILLFIFTIASQYTFVVLLYHKYKSVYYLIIFLSNN